MRLASTDDVVKSRLVDEDAVAKNGAVIEAINLENGQTIAGKVSARVVRPRVRLTNILRFSLKQLTKETYLPLAPSLGLAVESRQQYTTNPWLASVQRRHTAKLTSKSTPTSSRTIPRAVSSTASPPSPSGLPEMGTCICKRTPTGCL